MSLKINGKNKDYLDLKEIDASVLGKIMAAQNILFTLPARKNIADFCARLLCSIPGVGGCRMCLGDAYVSEGKITDELCTECNYSKLNETNDQFYSKNFTCKLNTMPDLYITALDTLDHRFGFIVIDVVKTELFSLYQPFIDNLASFISLTLDNRLHRNNLKKVSDALEIKVRERTDELQSMNINLQNEIEEHEHTENALAESKELFKFLFDTMVQGVVVQDSKSRIIDINAAACDILGLTKDQLLGKTTFDPQWKLIREDGTVLPPEEMPSDIALKTGKPVTGILIGAYNPETKSYRWILTNSMPKFKVDEKKPYLTITTFTNITERKQAETQLIASEQLFRTLVENSPDFVARYDRNFHRVYVNPAIMKLFGTKGKDIIGTTPLDKSPLPSANKYIENLKHVFETAQESTAEIPFRTINNEIHWGHLRFVPELDIEGKVATVLAIGRDIQEIKENEQRFRMLAENFPDFIARFNRECKPTYINFVFEHEFGISADAIDGKGLEELSQGSNPQQIKKLLKQIRRTFKDRTTKKYEDTWETKNGRHIFEIRLAPEKDAAGNIINVLSIARDVTEQKTAMENLVERQKHSQSLLRLSRRLEQAQSYREVFKAALEEVREIIGYKNLWAYLFSKDKKEATLLDAVGFKSDKIKSECGESIITVRDDRMMEELLGTKEILIIEDAQTDLRINKEKAAKLGNRTIVNMSIILFDGHLGSICMGTFKDEVIIIPTESEQEYLIAFASHLAVTLDRIHQLDERKKTEQELIKSEREYRLLVENIPDFIVRYDIDLRRKYVNPAWEKASGLSAAEVIKVPYADIPKVSKPISRDYVEKLKLALSTGDIQAVEFSWENTNGLTMFLEYVIVPEFDLHGKIIGLFSVGHDITARKSMEKEIQQLNQDLEKRVVERTLQLESANKELETFAYSVSHDLQSPLRGIDGFSQALLEDYQDKLDDVGKDYLHRVRNGTQYMSQLIDDMLKLSRVIRVDMNIQTVNLSYMVNEIYENLLRLNPERSVKFSIQPDIIVKGDSHLLNIVLTNLIDNAWKFTSLHRSAQIEFGRKQLKDMIIYYVRDDGAGIDMKYAKNIFSPFQRFHSTNEFPGTGIGLATVKRIIQRHGGTVWINSELEKGTTIYFTLQ